MLPETGLSDEMFKMRMNVKEVKNAFSIELWVKKGSSPYQIVKFHSIQWDLNLGITT